MPESTKTIFIFVFLSLIQTVSIHLFYYYYIERKPQNHAETDEVKKYRDGIGSSQLYLYTYRRSFPYLELLRCNTIVSHPSGVYVLTVSDT